MPIQLSTQIYGGNSSGTQSHSGPTTILGDGDDFKGQLTNHWEVFM